MSSASSGQHVDLLSPTNLWLEDWEVWLTQKQRQKQKDWSSTNLGRKSFWTVPKGEQVCCTTLLSQDLGGEEHK